MNTWNAAEYSKVQAIYQFEYGKTLVDKLIRIIDIKNSTVVDLGCGEGSLTNYTSDFLECRKNIIGVDLDEEMIQLAKRQYDIEFIVSDVIQWLKNDNLQYDVVISNAMLHWLGSYSLLYEFFKLLYFRLKDKGYAAIRFSLQDNGVELKQFLETNLREYTQNNNMLVAKSKFRFIDVESIVRNIYKVIEINELVFEPFKSDDLNNFKWVVYSQPLLKYLDQDKYDDFIRFLYDKWKNEKVLLRCRQCEMILKKEN